MKVTKGLIKAYSRMGQKGAAAGSPERESVA